MSQDTQEYNGAITILIDRDGASIEIADRASTLTFVKAELTVDQLALALSRRTDTPCKIETRGLGKVGKKMVMRDFEFEMPPHNYESRKLVAERHVREVCPEGWEPDTYFGSQLSFFVKDAQTFARTTIRKWE